MPSRFGKARNKNATTNKHKEPVEQIIDSIISSSDIILEILDSRFIEQTRQKDLEKKIENLGKRLIFVLNKSDLIDKGKLLRETELENLRPFVIFSAKRRTGIRELKKLIKKFAKTLKTEDAVVGIIGYPNAGKSSVVNILSGRSSAKVSSESGYTKSIQKIGLAKGIYLIDTPGIISDKLALKDRQKHSQIGALSWNKIRDPEIYVSTLINKNPKPFEEFYKIKFIDPEDFIEEVGRKLNFLKKGNAVDETRASRKILRDWQEGKIRT